MTDRLVVQVVKVNNGHIEWEGGNNHKAQATPPPPLGLTPPMICQSFEEFHKTTFKDSDSLSIAFHRLVSSFLVALDRRVFFFHARVPMMPCFPPASKARPVAAIA